MDTEATPAEGVGQTFVTYEVHLGEKSVPLRLPEPETVREILGDRPPEPWTVAYAAIHRHQAEIDGQGRVQFLALNLPPQSDMTGWVSPRHDILCCRTAHTHVPMAHALGLIGVIPPEEFWPAGRPGRVQDYREWMFKEHLIGRGWVRWFGCDLEGYSGPRGGVGFELSAQHLGDLRPVLRLMEAATPITATHHERGTGRHRLEGTAGDLMERLLDLRGGRKPEEGVHGAT